MARACTMKISEFYCTECGRRGIPLPRFKGNFREGGHLKVLFCPHCQKEVNHVEITSRGSYTYQDFYDEFTRGRFVNGERVPIKDLPFCNKECFNNVNGRCWNAKMIKNVEECDL